jgi:hypothetical protein
LPVVEPNDRAKTSSSAIHLVRFERQLYLQLGCGNDNAKLRSPSRVEQIEPASNARRTVLSSEEHDRPFRYPSILVKTVARQLPSTGL